MANLNRNYHIGPKAKLAEKAIMDSLDGETPYPGLYFLTLAANKLEQLDIVDSRTYFSPKTDIRMEIVGIACGKKEAMDLVKEIADEVYRKHRASDIRTFFQNAG